MSRETDRSVDGSPGDLYDLQELTVPVAGQVCTSREQLAAVADRRLAEAVIGGPDDSWWEADQ